MQYLLPGLSSFLVTVIITPIVIHFATLCKCFDVPGRRHLHKKSTPLWGGMAFFLGVLPVVATIGRGNEIISFIAASCIVVGFGIIDDCYKIGWRIKFAANFAAVTIVIFGGHAVIHTIGTYGYLGNLELGWLSVPFTYFSIIGITNAINLLDGLNGLAGGVSLIGFLFMGTAAARTGNSTVALVCFAFVGALAAFLLFNFPKAKIFMGDSGSLFLGFSLSLMAVYETQAANSSVDPMFPVLVLLLPLFDTLRVLFLRLVKRKNPFHADKGHLHHLLVRNKITPVATVVLLWSMTAFFGMVGFLLAAKTSGTYMMFALFVSLFLILLAVTLARRRRTPRSGEVAMRNVAYRRDEMPVVDLEKL